MRSEGYSTWSVCLSVCLSVRVSSRTTGYEAANEGHQRLLSNENIDIKEVVCETNEHSRSEM